MELLNPAAACLDVTPQGLDGMAAAGLDAVGGQHKLPVRPTAHGKSFETGSRRSHDSPRGSSITSQQLHLVQCLPQREPRIGSGRQEVRASVPEYQISYSVAVHGVWSNAVQDWAVVRRSAGATDWPELRREEIGGRAAHSSKPGVGVGVCCVVLPGRPTNPLSAHLPRACFMQRPESGEGKVGFDPCWREGTLAPSSLVRNKLEAPLRKILGKSATVPFLNPSRLAIVKGTSVAPLAAHLFPTERQAR